ncbi:hypothetical protein PSN45_003041 [Yamadazyma tenuis]|uniref:Mitochondrial carrier n=1 Tax=Candida tenuis (strain ATCC 10573 / BCRC 21748 / CBS 615 / JCM 9827 / NBRC 10315 / NRRL Y-1498 / VKM Y-70) TaxID=590646 RepID=G3AXE2_CANTC|nr:mitochondrial carrier [Yamadazyma tenuis ATCC 10573]EGV66352.1 mitochondrial carrier [Yamadazyma tenuis ATCC 10573]WEJ95521.1 hypothetical protein PSN45_003041 [Yamadazyma tenuis]
MSGDTDLRPYYNPDTFDAGYSVIYKPGVGLVDPHTGASVTSSIHPILNNSSTGRYNPGANIGLRGMAAMSKDSQEKDYFNDLEFSEYFDLNNLGALLRNLFWNFLKNYVKVIVLQPLEITRLVLQVGTFDFQKKPVQTAKQPLPRLMDESSELTPQVSQQFSDDDSDFEVNYFQSLEKSKSSLTPEVGSPRKSRAKSPSKSKKLSKKKHKIQPVSKHTVDIIAAIVSKDGPNALFRGLNAQFIHQSLSHTIEAWITGFLSPFLGIPDPFFLDLTHSTEPLRSLCLSVSACVLTGIILIPLDLVKVRLMITQFNKPYNKDADADLEMGEQLHTPQSTRSIRESLRNYPVELLVRPPMSISFLTVLHQFATSIFRKSAPYLLFIRFNIDQYSSPSWYTIFNLLLSIMEFFIKLPVENLLRKQQVSFLLQPKSLKLDPMRVVTIDNPDRDLIVDFNHEWKHTDIKDNKFKSTWRSLVNLGLFNGWRVGVLNIIGFWGYKIVQSGASIQEEKL